LRSSNASTEQDEVRVSRAGVAETLLVRIATRGENEGYVIAFDDVTDLVTAQRMAAWGDVARRIAHEIKNPLTPIQLSAGRIKRKFREAAGDEAEALDQMTDVIVRKTEDLRRIVDEFSKFARMPEPDTSVQDLTLLVKDAVTLQEASASNVELTSSIPEVPVWVNLDTTMIGQALTNLVKNAGEAIESAREKGGLPEDYSARIDISLTADSETALILISDNGVGLPEDRSRLFEPYVTTRSEGTGLGLPIVKKIIEEHGGSLVLKDAEPLDGSGHIGACAEIKVPLAAPNELSRDIKVAE
ncbi:MAG: ATP-binding protein, partial [Litoreibacter sp.]